MAGRPALLTTTNSPANPKYTKRRPFEQAVVGLLQELHDVHKSTPREQFWFPFLT
jgi:hypothetical protein